MKQHLKYILLLLVFIGTLQQSNAQTTISSSVTLTQSILNGYTWPVTINAGSSGSPLVVTLGEDVILSTLQNYFVINGEYVTFEGNNKSLTISGVTNYSGLINNGTSTTNGFSNLTIQNLGVLSSSSTLNENAGWIGQQYFSKNVSSNLISNCYSTGSINSFAGGIVGANATNFIATNCYSTGSISNGWYQLAAGGIVGANATNCTATNCYSTGTIGDRVGGIYGYGSTNCTATNCYSTGSINFLAGGIVGAVSTNCTATNCYSAGSIGELAGGIFGDTSSNSISTNCYGANGAFSSTTANTNLTGTDGSVWNTAVTPYTLSVFSPQKWGLSRNGLKTQDNTIQLDINGKKGTTSPVNENGKVN